MPRMRMHRKRMRARAPRYDRDAQRWERDDDVLLAAALERIAQDREAGETPPPPGGGST